MVSRSVFESCSASVFGGGGVAYHSAGVWADSVFRNNTAAYGGAMYLQGVLQCTRNSI